MTPLTAWLDCVGTIRDHTGAAGVAAELAAAGVEVGSPAGLHRDGAGILVMAETATVPDACAALQDRAEVTGGRVVVAVLGGRPDAAACWQLLAAGAGDVIAWMPGSRAVDGVAARLRRWHAVDTTVASPEVRDTLVGDDPAWRGALRQVVEAAAFTPAPILITGESGTGKELVARLVHDLDPRPEKGAFMVLDCTTVVPSLSGSEFFGHERGAFTGAVAARDGAFAAADGGTLFLDEVGELSTALQAELLRVVQEGAYKRVGGNTWQRTRFRLVCATNRDLAEEERRGAFRRDFYHRIAAWRCQLPSLRERPGDVLPLARYFAGRCCGGSVDLDPAVRAFLLARPYPGNVRELRSLVERLARRHCGPGPLSAGDIPEDERPPGHGNSGWRASTDLERAVRRAIAEGASLKDIAAQARDTAIRIAVAQEGGNLQRASRLLDVTDRALQLRRAAGSVG